ncbi:MAG TPA: hypothetical protein VN426_13660 [Syntrophomonadaceae bacterium]|nr:hypothetical protein [Syntrophomonadaceae bacterium]
MDNIIDKMVIEIYDGPNSECNSGCSTCGSTGCGSLTVEEQVKVLREDLNGVFGKSVEVKYYNTAVNGKDENGYCQQILEAGYKFPITMINGYPRIAGAINGPLIRQQLDQIALELVKEISGNMPQPSSNSNDGRGN